jgi:hypothetical protein
MEDGAVGRHKLGAVDRDRRGEQRRTNLFCRFFPSVVNAVKPYFDLVTHLTRKLHLLA